ncbi:hypothetical protein ACNFJ7_17645 (plasmid) [Sphingomonas sp. HT-1]|uniref:Lipoprotein n=1 Tax=Sphingobium cupriresistens LL01 TaxID=1420583 RepID=A0A0J7XIC9_9SPHN|nr:MULTISPECIES: hypothetical protein [Sphingomonadaceae]KMS51781.1 hypothetical protein V473_22880 [Sphingobium cupriresistens LL01]KTF70259.1 hypothetical protein ATB93_05255 [Sphingomonas sp. WG]
MTKGLCLAGLLLTLAACGTKESKSDESNLRSDMPLRSAKYFMQNKDELTEVDTICTAWKASQRPPLSWPAVVVNNCNNVDTAKTLLLNKNETDKLRREAGI